MVYPCPCFRDADETISWISEKDAVLSSDDFGKDLASVQTLQRKHEGVERDLAALEVTQRLIWVEKKLYIRDQFFFVIKLSYSDKVRQASNRCNEKSKKI